MNKKVILVALVLAAGVFACGEEGSEQKTANSEQSEEVRGQSEGQTDDSSSSSSSSSSKLTLFMRSVEDHMKAAKEDVLAGENFRDTLNLGFGPVGYYEPSDHVGQDEEAYKAFTQDLLNKTSGLLSADVADRHEAYNLVVQSCVNCHESYCPGPIPRIKKLKISLQ